MFVFIPVNAGMKLTVRTHHQYFRLPAQWPVSESSIKRDCSISLSKNKEEKDKAEGD